MFHFLYASHRLPSPSAPQERSRRTSAMKRRFAQLLALTVGLSLPASSVPQRPPATAVQVLSKTYSITRKYKSMEGPASSQ